MAQGFIASIVNGWLDGSFPTADMHAKLHTGDPSAAGTSNAATGDTTRKNATMGAAAGGVKAMTSMSGDWTNGGATETITDLSWWTDAAAGTIQCTVELTDPQPWVATNTLSLDTFSIAITPIAV